MIVAVSGVMAAGKSTLIKNISLHSEFFPVDESSIGLSYLDDLFSEPQRWAYEAQIAFLVGKSKCLSHASMSNRVILLDRSLEEDAKIFFEYFYNKFIKNERARSTYYTLYDIVHEVVEPPSIQIFCEVSLSTVTARINERVDKFKDYFHGHLEDIYLAYEEYQQTKQNTPNVFFIDSEVHDWRKESVVIDVVRDLNLIIDDIQSGRNGSLELKILNSSISR